MRTLVIPTAMAAGGITIFSKISHGNTLRYTFVPTLFAPTHEFHRLVRSAPPLNSQLFVFERHRNTKKVFEFDAHPLTQVGHRSHRIPPRCLDRKRDHSIVSLGIGRGRISLFDSQ